MSENLPENAEAHANPTMSGPGTTSAESSLEDEMLLATPPLAGEMYEAARRGSVEEEDRPNIAGYDIERSLGRGTFGRVWLASEEGTGIKVAIKEFLTTRECLRDMQSEIDQLAVLAGDAGIVRLMKANLEADPPYFIMDYCEGGSLAAMLARSGPLPLERAVDLFTQAVESLAFVHVSGIIHCDLKPANIMLDRPDSADRFGRPRLIDFGQAHLTRAAGKGALGTFFYMPPDQASLHGVHCDTRWDVYALGATFYAMLVGRPPHQNPEVQRSITSTIDLPVRLQQYSDYLINCGRPTEHEDVAGMDPMLCAIIDRCLELDPKKRFESAGRILAALKNRQEQARLRSSYFVPRRDLISRDFRHLPLGPMPLANAVNAVTPILRQLSLAHDKGLVHGHLAAELIYVAPGGRVAIGDWAIASATKTMTGDALPSFLTPEPPKKPYVRILDAIVSPLSWIYRTVHERMIRLLPRHEVALPRVQAPEPATPAGDIASVGRLFGRLLLGPETPGSPAKLCRASIGRWDVSQYIAEPTDKGEVIRPLDVYAFNTLTRSLNLDGKGTYDDAGDVMKAIKFRESRLRNRRKLVGLGILAGLVLAGLMLALKVAINETANVARSNLVAAERDSLELLARLTTAKLENKADKTTLYLRELTGLDRFHKQLIAMTAVLDDPRPMEDKRDAAKKAYDALFEELKYWYQEVRFDGNRPVSAGEDFGIGTFSLLDANGRVVCIYRPASETDAEKYTFEDFLKANLSGKDYSGREYFNGKKDDLSRVSVPYQPNRKPDSILSRPHLARAHASSNRQFPDVLLTLSMPVGRVQADEPGGKQTGVQNREVTNPLGVLCANFDNASLRRQISKWVDEDVSNTGRRVALFTPTGKQNRLIFHSEDDPDESMIAKRSKDFQESGNETDRYHDIDLSRGTEAIDPLRKDACAIYHTAIQFNGAPSNWSVVSLRPVDIVVAPLDHLLDQLQTYFFRFMVAITLLVVTLLATSAWRARREERNLYA